MKISMALISLGSVLLVSCSSGSPGSSGGGSPVGTFSDKAAVGVLNGTAGQYSSGFFSLAKDDKGNDVYLITLVSGSVACNALSSATGSINILVPAKTGVFGFPQASVVFSYIKNGTSQNDVASDGAIKITTSSTVNLTGSVHADYGASSINGAFVAISCGANSSSSGSATPVPPVVSPAPGTPIVTAPAPTDPSQITAIPATSWDQVKYAFCSAQGNYGALIDFQGSDLSKQTTGSFKMATRPCDGSAPFQWANPGTFTFAKSKEGITLDFGPSQVVDGQENTIQFSNGDFTNGYGVIDGNSGPCALLTNEATGGLYEQDPSFACK